MSNEIRKSTSIMQYVLYGVIALIILAGLGAALSDGSGTGSSTTTSNEELMF